MKINYCMLSLCLLFSCMGKERFDDHYPSNKILSTEQLKERATKSLTPTQYISWVNNPENGLIRSKEIANISYAVICKPSDYIVCKELKTEEIKQTDYQNIISDLGDMQYFDLRIGIENYEDEFIKYKSGGSGEYQDRVDYCSFRMQQDINIVCGADTFPCELYHFERTFGISPYGDFLLGFRKIPAGRNFTLIFHDQLFKNGWIKFAYQNTLLTYLPKLEIL